MGDQTLLHAGVCGQALRGGWDRGGPSQERGGGHSGQDHGLRQLAPNCQENVIMS